MPRLLSLLLCALSALSARQLLAVQALDCSTYGYVGKSAVTVSSFEELACAVEAQVGAVSVSESVSFAQTIAVDTGADIAITGTGSNVTLSLSAAVPLFRVTAGSALSLSSLALSGSDLLLAKGDSLLQVHNATLRLAQSTLTHTHAQCGAALYAERARVELVSSSVDANVALSAEDDCAAAAVLAQDSHLFAEDALFRANNASSAAALLLRGSRATLQNTRFARNVALVADGGALKAENSTISLENCVFEANVAVRDGGALSLTQHSAASLANVSLSHNIAGARGGAISLSSSSYLSLTQHSALIANAAVAGGALHCAEQGTRVFVNATRIFANTASASGGAVSVTSGCAANISFAELEGNVVTVGEAPITFGGAVTCQLATLSLSRSSLAHSAASQGAALFLFFCDADVDGVRVESSRADSGAVFAVRSRLSLSRSLFAQNTASESAAALRCAEDSLCDVSRCEFRNNTAVASGGAVEALRSTTTLKDSLFAHNSVRGAGGAVSFDGSLAAEITRCTFTDNTAGNRGGAVAVSALSSLSLSLSSFERNRASTGGALFVFDASEAFAREILFVADSAADSGGAVFVSDHSSLTAENVTVRGARCPYGAALYVDFNSSAQLSNLTAYENVAGYAGGAIAAFNDARVYISASTISHNVAALGGAISGQFRTHITIEDTKIFRNKASAYGGAVYALVESFLSVTQCDFTHNTALYGGGAMYFEASAGDITLSVVRNHTANSGAALLLLNSDASLSFSDVSFNGGNASFQGGAVSLSTLSSLRSTGNIFIGNGAQYGGTLSFDDSSWDSSEDALLACVGVTGACVYAAHDSQISLHGDEFSANDPAQTMIGVLFMTSGALFVRDSLFARNTVQMMGALSLLSVRATIENSRFVDNRATSQTSPDGGALYLACAVPCIAEPALSTHIRNCSFAGNTAQHGLGGAVFVDGFPGDITIDDALFESNSARNGGAVTVRNTAVQISNCSFFSNQALEGGGAVFWFYNSAKQTTIVNATAARNGAAYGELHATDMVSLTTNFAPQSAQVSGAVLTAPINVTQLDFYAQTITHTSLYDSASLSIYCNVVGDSGVIRGQSIVAAERGVASFTQVVLTGVPLGVTQLRFSVPIASIADVFQNVSFRACESGEITVNVGQGLASCQRCSLGTYSLFPTDSACSVCPSHAHCPGGNVLDVEKNYWRVNELSASILACPVPDICLGGTNTSAQCVEGNMGPYCSVCAEGYTQSSSGDCYSCESSTDLVAEIFSTVLFVLCVGLVLLAVKYRHRLLALYARYVSSTLRNPKVRTLNVKAKIVIAFCQIVYQLGPAFNVVFPVSFLRFLNYYSLFQLNLLLLPDVNCMFEANYYDALLFSTLSPPILFVVLAVAIQLRALYAKRLNERNPSYTLAQAQTDTITLAFLISYFVLVNVSTKIFQVFQCETFDNGESFLVADYSISCDAPGRVFYVTYGAVMIFVYPIGIPAVYALILFRNRKLINPDWRKVVDASEKSVVSNKVIQREKIKVRDTYDEIKKIKNLYESYVPKRWYFELFDCARRLCLGAIPVLVFRGSTLQIIVVLLVSLCSVATFMHFQPYIHQRDNQLAIIAQWSITLVVVSAMIIRVQALEPSDTNQRGLGVVLIMINLFVVVFSIASAIVNSKGEELEDPLGIVEVGDDAEEDAEEGDKGDAEKGETRKRRNVHNGRGTARPGGENELDLGSDYEGEEDDDGSIIDSDDEKPPSSRNKVTAAGEEKEEPASQPQQQREKRAFFFSKRLSAPINIGCAVVGDVEMNPMRSQSILTETDDTRARPPTLRGVFAAHQRSLSTTSTSAEARSKSLANFAATFKETEEASTQPEKEQDPAIHASPTRKEYVVNSLREMADSDDED